MEDAGARYTYGCSSAAEFHRTVAPGYTLLHDVPFTRTIGFLAWNGVLEED